MAYGFLSQYNHLENSSIGVMGYGSNSPFMRNLAYPQIFSSQDACVYFTHFKLVNMFLLKIYHHYFNVRTMREGILFVFQVLSSVLKSVLGKNGMPLSAKSMKKMMRIQYCVIQIVPTLPTTNSECSILKVS